MPATQSDNRRRAWLCGAVLLVAAVAIGFADPRSGRLLLNTALLAGGALAISLPVGTLLAVALFRTDAPGRRGAATLLGALLFLPLFVQAAGWQAGLGPQGWLSSGAA